MQYRKDQLWKVDFQKMQMTFSPKKDLTTQQLLENSVPPSSLGVLQNRATAKDVQAAFGNLTRFDIADAASCLALNWRCHNARKVMSSARKRNVAAAVLQDSCRRALVVLAAKNISEQLRQTVLLEQKVVNFEKNLLRVLGKPFAPLRVSDILRSTSKEVKSSERFSAVMATAISFCLVENKHDLVKLLLDEGALLTDLKSINVQNVNNWLSCETPKSILDNLQNPAASQDSVDTFENAEASHNKHTSTPESKNSLENYTYSLKNSLSEEKTAEKIDASEKAALSAKIDTTIKWIESSQGAEAEEYQARQKELEGVAMPIMTRLKRLEELETLRRVNAWLRGIVPDSTVDELTQLRRETARLKETIEIQEVKLMNQEKELRDLKSKCRVQKVLADTFKRTLIGEMCCICKNSLPPRSCQKPLGEVCASCQDKVKIENDKIQVVDGPKGPFLASYGVAKDFYEGLDVFSGKPLAAGEAEILKAMEQEFCGPVWGTQKIVTGNYGRVVSDMRTEWEFACKPKKIPGSNSWQDYPGSENYSFLGKSVRVGKPMLDCKCVQLQECKCVQLKDTNGNLRFWPARVPISLEVLLRHPVAQRAHLIRPEVAGMYVNVRLCICL
jgi:hypothetical protein